ncbi:MAG: hypothetical protein LUD72_02405 [Bacteroidales bacterium]|nr:hypothetical protein [Bacteroidales bacterium]
MIEERETPHSYTVSGITIPGIRGMFYQNENGSIDLVFPREDALAGIGLPRIPFRITTAIASHILTYHGRELRIYTLEQAVSFAVNVMKDFDHIRKGTDEGSYIFSIENGRGRVGKRTIGIVVETNEGQFLRAKTAGFENLERLRQREQLWEEGAENSISPTDTASANVTTVTSQQGGEMPGSASNQSASLSDCEDNENSDSSK